MYEGIVLQGTCDVMAMIYTLNICTFVDKKNFQIVTKFASVPFNNQVKALKHDGHICTFINFMLALILQNNEAIKGLSGEAKMITVALL